jgi:hypothetical protein
MRRILLALFALLTPRLLMVKAQAESDVSHISGYVTPYYNSDGPIVDIGPLSSGLASTNETEILTTIAKMKKGWSSLTFPELYVGSIRLYDFGYRKEAIYWFYTANYRGRQFSLLADENKIGGVGDKAFELTHAQDAFCKIVGPYIEGYAFADPDNAAKVIERVKKEGRNISDLRALYPGVAFRDEGQWKQLNDSLADGMSQLIALTKNKDELKRQRAASGADVDFSHLLSKDLPAQR